MKYFLFFVQPSFLLVHSKTKKIGSPKKLTNSLNVFEYYLCEMTNLYIIIVGQPTIPPRNGGCEPRIICRKVPVNATLAHSVAAFPQCVEVHRCDGTGCCQEFESCTPIEAEKVTFSPVNINT